ncbi:cinnamoyl-CoA reductase-like SNL6 [Nicotiana tomentosiformis]|uniref:cinnamoyl-CoA reductase-like SNL6 n=1 Tax=Nicotiana tomentosiformis TaxID=4098 RepID=UPI00051C3AA6|nr:cinnamoyl-CoA reductase-like SNL6 [Nicotiana tomentosiformis]XP_033510912.1 cinnamoyl-CoA reductase-like SNL6 [Nicotiana tomentosiformis]
MGIVCPDESKRIEIEEFRRMLLSYAAVHRTKAAAAAADDEFRNPQQLPTAVQQNRELEEKKVCVTSGVSFLGIAIVNQLLLRGYSVRVIVEKQEDLEKLREMEITGEMRQSKSSTVEAVMANLNDVQSLSEAFNGCRGVFHTAAFVDPAGLSGYSKSMAEVEVMVSKNMTQACAVTPSVKYCMLTSSLLACVWKDLNSSTTIDNDSWSDESICINKKLWYALGKLKAERVAWNVAKESGFKLATICPGLVTGPDFLSRNPTSTIAYLKGAQEMFRNGLLATVDVNRLAISHVLVFEEMKNTASGRYISFERVIRSEEDFEKLARETGTEIRTSTNSIIGASNTHRIGIKLSNAKLCRLMSATFRCNS